MQPPTTIQGTLVPGRMPFGGFIPLPPTHARYHARAPPHCGTLSALAHPITYPLPSTTPAAVLPTTCRALPPAAPAAQHAGYAVTAAFYTAPHCVTLYGYVHCIRRLLYLVVQYDAVAPPHRTFLPRVPYAAMVVGPFWFVMLG